MPIKKLIKKTITGKPRGVWWGGVGVEKRKSRQSDMMQDKSKQKPLTMYSMTLGSSAM
jgi:hypothetical protein